MRTARGNNWETQPSTKNADDRDRSDIGSPVGSEISVEQIRMDRGAESSADDRGLGSLLLGAIGCDAEVASEGPANSG